MRDSVSARRAAAAAALLLVASTLLGAASVAADGVRNGQYWLDEYGVRAAWDTTRGEGVTIAVIDTGVDGSVAELRGTIVAGADFSGLGSADGQLPVGSVGSEHGTMVAALAAGRGTGENSGVIGTAPKATILAISIGFGEGTVSSDDQIAQAVRWAVDHGADVINMSLTRNTLDWPVSWDEAFLYAEQNDVVVVAAAGNRGSGTTQVGAPATMPGVLTVAGVDINGEASFDASSQGITIGVAAASENLVGVVPGGGHVIWNGTSGATPIVAGIVALVRSAHPELDAANVINRVLSTARDEGAPGADPIYGFGLVDAEAAVNARVPRVEENPMGTMAEWIRLYRRAEATPDPGATGVASPSPTPSPPPVTAPPSNPLGTLLPTVNQLRNVGIPLAVVVVFLAITSGLVIAAVRHVRALRRTL